MSAKRSPTLPLGAVRADDGSVVVPESRRADGSVRKPIRIRQGYVPQDEVPKYKPIGQRLREEQQAKQQRQIETPSADAVADEIGALSLAPTAEKPRELRDRSASKPRSAESADPSTSKELKTELSGVNKALREITKLESFAAAFERGDDGSRPLTAAQERKVERKTHWETRRREIIAALDSNPVKTETSKDAAPKTLREVQRCKFRGLTRAYFLYTYDFRADAKAANPNASAIDMAQLLAERCAGESLYEEAKQRMYEDDDSEDKEEDSDEVDTIEEGEVEEGGENDEDQGKNEEQDEEEGNEGGGNADGQSDSSPVSPAVESTLTKPARDERDASGIKCAKTTEGGCTDEVRVDEF